MKDKDIREPLFDYIDNHYGKLRILEELAIRKSIADVVVTLEHSLIGIEIKSDADTYTRLPSQIKDYNHFFDYNYIAVGKSHAKQVHKHIPDSWGILCVYSVDSAIQVELLREAKQNKRTKPQYQIKLMWRLELNNILARHHLPKYRGKSKRFVQLKLIEKLDEKTLKDEICQELFERDYTLLY